MKRIVMLLFSLLAVIVNVSAYTVEFETFRKDCEIMLSKKSATWSGDYSKLPVNVVQKVIIDNSEKTITIGVDKYEFMDYPKWNVSQTYRSVSYECIDIKSLGKVKIYYIEYDKTDNCRMLVIWYDVEDKPIEIYNMRRKK